MPARANPVNCLEIITLAPDRKGKDRPGHGVENTCFAGADLKFMHAPGRIAAVQETNRRKKI
jgi:protein tyrosine phosphatase (PTP) superfamily phosphohydrolase (DUF442 family)